VLGKPYIAPTGYVENFIEDKQVNKKYETVKLV